MNQRLENLPEMRWVLSYDGDGRRTLSIVGKGTRAEVVLSDEGARALITVLSAAPKAPVYR